jgi:hypothetical protein
MWGRFCRSAMVPTPMEIGGGDDIALMICVPLRPELAKGRMGRAR